MPLLYIIYRFIWQLKKKNQDLLIKLINRWLKLLNQVGIKQQLHEQNFYYIYWNIKKPRFINQIDQPVT